MSMLKPIDRKDIMTDEKFIIAEIKRFYASDQYRTMVQGLDYFLGNHDILKRKRTVIGDDGDLIEVENLPNNRLVDNQYRKMVKQKVNYLLGKPLTYQAENEIYVKHIKDIFDKRFQRLLKNIGKDVLNCGIAWCFVYYDESGNFKLKKFSPLEVIPEWKDSEHTELDMIIRTYKMLEYKDIDTTEEVTKVEVYTLKGVDFYILEGDRLIPEEPYHRNYLTMGNTELNWDRIPFIAFKFNEEETPLIKQVKSLQDALNLVLSNFGNAMEEDVRNTVMVLVNYDGEDLGKFRRNLATYGAVKVRSIDGVSGDLKTLQIEVNPENYKTIIAMLKKAIIENAMGYDAKDDRVGANANQMNILSMYSDIDLEANDMETEFQASFEDLLYFTDLYLKLSLNKDFSNDELEIIFDKYLPMNETERIQNILNSSDLSLETRLANHPWVSDVDVEMNRKNQEYEELDSYRKSFIKERRGYDGNRSSQEK